MLKTDSICPLDVSKSLKLKGKTKKMMTNTRNKCLDYEKCSKEKCNYPDLELKNEIRKLDLNQVMKITTKCLKNKNPLICSLDAYGKCSPKLKKITDRVKTCKMNTCKKENNEMIKSSMGIFKKMKLGKNFSKVKKLIKTNKNFKKIMKKAWKKI